MSLLSLLLFLASYSKHCFYVFTLSLFLAVAATACPSIPPSLCLSPSAGAAGPAHHRPPTSAYNAVRARVRHRPSRGSQTAETNDGDGSCRRRRGIVPGEGSSLLPVRHGAARLCTACNPPHVPLSATTAGSGEGGELACLTAGSGEGGELACLAAGSRQVADRSTAERRLQNC